MDKMIMMIGTRVFGKLTNNEGMNTRTKSMVLIKDYRFRAGDDLEFYAKDVNLEGEVINSSACPKTTAVYKYIGDEIKQLSDPFIWNPSIFSDNKLNPQMDEGVRQSLCQMLPDPFLQIQVYTGHEGYSYKAVLILDRSLPLGDTAEAGHRDISREEMGQFRDASLLLRISLGWKEVSVNISTQSLMVKLFKDESTKDLTIVPGNGSEIKCHQLIFAAHADAFSAMLSPNSGMKEAASKRINMPKNSEEPIRQLVRYLYGIEISISDMDRDVSLELFQIAHQYGLTQLESSLLKFLMARDKAWFTPDGLLEMYFYVRNLTAFQKLRDRILLIMAKMPTEELRDCDEFKKLDKEESVNLLLCLLNIHQKVRQQVGSWDSGAKRRRT